ncbi:cytochrome c oxidase subunit 7A2b [Nothobranchius furzeri]|uniref:Cytochrome c oxidase subunit 7A2, mitochondrial n=2 Tax=Nothobranchius TaxID=28779 RepID=A0A1A8AG13_NOTFU|nr:cytochrome c oxidase subunit 7A2, mitochondrial [Nothobranchius furzeri]KAF7231390.1 mitochondrial [Nothobranchius furzeri]
MFRHMIAFQQVARRSVSSSIRRQIENKVPEKQKLFQEDNGIPVHLKGGTADALLYRMTMSLSVLGVGYVLYELVKASFPQKKV